MLPACSNIYHFQFELINLSLTSMVSDYVSSKFAGKQGLLMQKDFLYLLSGFKWEVWISMRICTDWRDRDCMQANNCWPQQCSAQTLWVEDPAMVLYCSMFCKIKYVGKSECTNNVVVG